ncbi:MAG: hypothetical protein JW939_03830, partial [Candidatus Thermoplasmatota archaeon]|nr:hypothetical protein [Candidatus Thermoplasmatota archaeon]
MGGPVGHKFKAGVLVVGSEMLLGRTRDTNTIFLAENLLKKGIRLMRWVIVPDDKEMIGDELRDYIEDEYDMVMISGGMGPTHDDVTVEAVANALSVPLAFNEECFGRMLRKWRRRNPDRTFQESSRKGLEKMAL